MICIAAAGVAVYAQDPLELLYNFEILKPSHAPKPKVEGFAVRRIEDRLDRGVVAVDNGKGVYVSWRLLKSDPPETAFNVYRGSDARPVKLNAQPVAATTDFVDKNGKAGDLYRVAPVINGQEGALSEKTSVIVASQKSSGEPPYISVPLPDSILPGRRRLGVGDLDGDGLWDFVLLHPGVSKDPGARPDSSSVTYKIDAYRSDGAFLWRHEMGDGIEPGVWYSPFIVYDFDGDGRAEIAVKTAPTGIRAADGCVYGGEEWLSVLDGLTGRETARVPWPTRTLRLGNYNSQHRNQLGVAYLDGRTPCLIVARGTYKAMFVDAYQYTDGKLARLWSWDGDEENPIVRSQGSHSMQVADVDGDGRDEIILGSAVLDDDGTLLWSAGLGHPDKVYVADIDPAHPGLEIFYVVEALHDSDGLGICLRDARTGALLWSIGRPVVHAGSGMVADIDPARPGLECFAAEDSKGHRAMRIPGNSNRYLFDATGNLYGEGDAVPPMNDWLWWDADDIREFLYAPSGGERGWARGAVVAKYGREEPVREGFRGMVVMTADLFGDWREEIVTALPGELRIYTTTIPAADSRVTLMQNNTYRQTVTVRTMGYQQSPVPAY